MRKLAVPALVVMNVTLLALTAYGLRKPMASPSAPKAVVAAPAPTVAPPAPAAAPRATPLQRRTATPSGEPVLTDPRFAGKTRTEWRRYWGDDLNDLQRQLADARRVLERAQRGEPVSENELGEARMNVKDLTRRIPRDEEALRELESAR
jgi:hypothetical protein